MILEPKIQPPEPLDPRDLKTLKPFLKEYPWLDPKKLPAALIKRFLCMIGHQVRPVATVQLNVTEFHSITNLSDSNNGVCVIDDPIVTNNPIAPGNPTGRGRIVQVAGDMHTLRISRGSGASSAAVPLLIEFVITSGVPRRQYEPVGIFIDDTGLVKNFSLASVQGNVIRVLNHYVEAPKYWEFMIGVRDTTSGQIGIIDPGMEDTDEPF